MAQPTITSATPGNIVVPLSAILDQLQGKLSAADLNALLLAVVGQRRDEVRPGDLITADLMNQVLATLADLQMRVAQLETGGERLRILEASPASPRVGETLTVTGINFPLDPGNGNVQISGITVDRFIAASDTRLVFSVPSGFPILPGDYLLTVRNGGFSDTHSLRILPASSNLTGSVLVSNRTSSLPEIIVGDDYTAEFLVDSQTNVGESYRIAAKYLNVTGTTASHWLENTTVTEVSTGETVTGSRQIRIEPGLPQAFRVAFTVPAGADTADLLLSAESVTKPGDPGLNQVSNPPLHLEVGEAVTPSDPRTTFSILNFGPTANARKAVIDGVPGVEVKFGLSANIRVQANFGESGRYTYTRQILPNTTGWTIGAISPAAPTSEEPGSTEQIGVAVTCLGTTSEKRTLVIKAERAADTGGPAFSSWIEIPIRGYSA